MLELESPRILWALVPLVPFLVYGSWKSYADLASTRARVALLLRSLSLALLVFALSKPVLLLANHDRAVLFLIDVSDSVPDGALEDAWRQVTEATEDLDKGELAGVVAFARSPRLVAAPSAAALGESSDLRARIFHRRESERARTRIQELERSSLSDVERAELDRLRAELDELDAWRDELGTDDTDLEAACRLARGVLPHEARRRLVVFSDGNATRGDWMRELAELERAGITLHARLLAGDEQPEVLAEEVKVPAEAQVKAPFPVELYIQSNVETKAEVKLYRNKYLITTKEVQLTSGRNRLEIPKMRLDEGFHQFEAFVQPQDDTELRNNVARAVVRVAGRPKVLIVERLEDQARYLEEALTGEEFDVEVRPESGVPQDIDDLLNYDAIVLSDIAADRFGPGQMEAVKTYVRSMGGGLVMVGGEHSFGLGGYYRTPIEDCLPVRMPIKKNLEKPNLSLALVIDKSGSMSGVKIELAKEAAIASAEVLKGNDRFGVVAFDSRAEWICSMTESSDLGLISSTVARLVPGGGTNIYPALYDAYQALLDEDAKLKHIILLSDGQTTGSGYDTLVGHIAADGITVSTVGIGDGADRRLLSDMASWGGGESYFTNDFGAIPQIFTRETMRASKSMLIEEPFIPIQTAESAVLKGIVADDMPFLLGYVATQPKGTATVALSSEYGDPVLATWSYGLGRSVAFTSDAKARWAADWIGWESFGKFWGQLIRSVMSTGAHRDLRTRTHIDVEGGLANVTIDVRDRRGAYRDDVVPEVSLLDEEANPSPLTVTHVGPGLYEAAFPIESYGELQRLLVVQKQAGEIVDLRALGVTQSYSPEFASSLPNRAVLQLAAERTGGVFEPEREAIWQFEGDPARTPRDTWWWWLLTAALLLPIDIAVRRLGA